MQYLRILEPVFLVGAIAAGLLSVLAASLSGAFRRKSKRLRLVQALLYFILGSGPVMTLAVTLLPQGVYAPHRFVSFNLIADARAQFVDFPSSTAVLQFGINMALLSWLAVSLTLLSDRIRTLKATAVCLVVSIAIEGLQYILATGRSATLFDVVLNTSGAFLAAAFSVYYLLPRIKIWVDARQQEAQPTHQ